MKAPKRASLTPHPRPARRRGAQRPPAALAVSTLRGQYELAGMPIARPRAWAREAGLRDEDLAAIARLEVGEVAELGGGQPALLIRRIA
jgi:hypothetical protein